MAHAGSPGGGVVGDANGDGVFGTLDVTFAKTALRHRSTRPNPLADVARPCNGTLEPADGQRLLAASLVAKDGIRVRSRCHREWIGEAIQPPPQSPPQPPPLVTIDSLFLDIAERVPEFGGLFVESGEPRVALTDPAALESAWVEIERVFGRGRFDASRARAVHARYAFSELAQWKEEAEALLGQGPVTLVDADERRNVLRVGLLDLAERGNIERELVRRGVPLAAVAFEARRPAALTLDPLTSALRQKQRPLVGGLFIETEETGCSVGFLAKLFGLRGFITNSHCLWPMGESTEKMVFQDGHDFSVNIADLDDRIGFEHDDPPFASGGSRLSDAAFVALEPDETGHLGWLAGSPGAPPPASFLGHYTVTGEGVAVCGEEVRRVGATSGEVWAEVTATCCGFEADTSEVPGAPPETFYGCQTTYDAPTESGDSGGPVFRRLGLSSEVELLGVHCCGFEGESAFSPLSNIETNIGPLEVTAMDELPEIEITAPPDGSSLGPGAFPVAHLVAEVFDFEAGGDCPTCQVSWYSAKDGGPLGVTPWTAATSSLDAVLGGGPGYRAITATATDAASQTAWDTIVLSSGNGPPNVWIDWPPPSTLYRNVPYQLQGSSFDSESFQALPCADLTWTVLAGPSTASFPASGCFPVVTFESTGLHFLKLHGVDAGNLDASAWVNVEVVNAPASAPPVVTFETPSPGEMVPFAAPVTVVATVHHGAGPMPLTLEWHLSSPALAGGAFLGAASITSGEQTSITFQPSSFLPGGCGAVPMTVYLYATTPTVVTGFGTLPLEALRPPC